MQPITNIDDSFVVYLFFIVQKFNFVHKWYLGHYPCLQGHPLKELQVSLLNIRNLKITWSSYNDGISNTS